MAEKESLLSSSDSDENEKQALNSQIGSGSDGESTAKGYSAIAGLDDVFAGLPDQDAETLREQVHISPVQASFLRLFRYARRKDIAILALGVVVSVGEGIMRPLLAIVFGAATQEFTDLPSGSMMSYFNGSYYNWYNSTYDADYNITKDGFYYESYNSTGYGYDYNYMDNSVFVRNVSRFSLYFFLLGIAVTILTFTKAFVFIDRADVLSSRIREHYLAATLRQNIGYFDKLGSGEITTRISSDTVLLQDAMSEKVSYVLSHSSTFIAGVIIAYSRSYILSSIIIGNVIMIILTSYFGSKIITKFSERSQEGYSVGGSLAEETISTIRNVQAFGIQDRMARAYDSFLASSEKWGIRAGYASGLRSGLTFLFSMSIDALAYWQGIRLLTEGKIDVATLMTTTFTLSQGAFSFTIISPYLTSISIGIAASTKIFATIDRKSAIDSSSEEGERLAEVKGDIELRNVRFIYPSRPNVTVLRDFSLKVPAGKTVALVGASGSGKSTIVGLIERFYNPLSGEILLDGRNILNLNTRWLRQKIALVSQEPSLFACSIFENVCYGLIGTPYENASDVEKRELVVDACKQANAWDFIQTLPNGLDTGVGERGILMSGGQKQRIAIARAIVANPKILLLDEATSALDTKSEGVVQEALDRASKKRTTIVIAHRLSTIKDADLIIVMRTGEIIEQGTHTELLDMKGEYYNLVRAQSIEAVKETTESSDSITDDAEADATGIELSKFGSALTGVQTKRTVASAIFHKKVEVTKPASVVDIISMIYSISRRDLTVLLIGLYSGAITGMAYIGLSVLYGTAIQRIQEYNNPNDYAMLRRTVYAVAAFLFMQAVVLLISSCVSGGMFGYSSSRLVHRIRALVFRHLLRQDISYFDDSEHTTGSLTSSLARDAQSIESVGGATANKLVESIVTSFGGFIFCVAFGYKLGLALLSAVPVMLAIGYFRFKFMTAFSETMTGHHAKSSNYACEATSSIRTVLSLTREQEILDGYRRTLAVIIERNRIANIKSAALVAIGRGMQYYVIALAFYYGGILVASGEYSINQFFIIFIIVIFGLENATTIFSFAPEMSKALQAGRNIKKLLDSEPEIDAWSTEGGVIPTDEINGEIEFRDVYFRYPTRSDVPVLRGLNLSVKKGQFVALVGASGCGKSTTIGLIESFYRPQWGTVFVDGRDISTLNVSEYRKNIALVQQEPVLYAGTVRYNVALGSPSTVTDEEIIEACKQANIHDFITSLPEGYDTICGTKGSLLSGGQKQRIAIAKALVRKPKILLLDEATSALDSESEKIVQAALDQAAKGRTTIAVAHRLSTIQNADVIYVFENGKILESGTHQQLLANRSKYFELVQLQALEKN
ncbi:P-loop containing nucleoside triphosphate hydrolase protein [Lipomyces chichibuensis]|uniref:P-loop containing nucleoside triphosphate hydrolase protein n=1 Tax=Lipomyces chichibuensis TaxID=1546026 RepID=UPI003343A557